MARWVPIGAYVAFAIWLIAAGPRTRLLGFAFLVSSAVGVLISTVARRRGSLAERKLAQVYDASPAETFAALRSAIEQLGYRVRSVDTDQRQVTFNTGISMKTIAGQDFTGVVREEPSGRGEIYLVGATCQRGLGALQSVSWGETDLLARRVLEQVETELRSATRITAQG